MIVNSKILAITINCFIVLKITTYFKNFTKIVDVIVKESNLIIVAVVNFEDFITIN